MVKYFDKDFWKFFLAFVTIVSISLVIIIATKLYEESQISFGQMIKLFT